MSRDATTNIPLVDIDLNLVNYPNEKHLEQRVSQSVTYHIHMI